MHRSRGKPARGLKRSRGAVPRATVSKTARFIVGRGPVPRHARSRRKSARSLKRSRGTGPRATVARTSHFIVGRGPVPRHAAVYQTLAGDRPPRYGSQNRPFCRSRAPALDPMAIRRSQTTEGELAMLRSRGTGPRATGQDEKKRGGQAPALR